MMKSIYPPFARQLIMLCLVLSCGPGVNGEEIAAGSDYAATTVSDPDVEIEDLELMLHPLTVAELTIEAAAWQGKLQQQAKKLSQAELKAVRLSREADKAAEQEQERKSENIDTDTSDLVKEVAALRLNQLAIGKRMETVLSEMEKKGGDTTELRFYASAFSGIEVDLSSTQSSWLAVKAWLGSDEGGVPLLVNSIKFIIAICFVMLLARVAGRVADRLTRTNKVSSLLENFVRVAARRTVLFVGFIVALSILGVNIAPVLALIGAAGLVVGLALQGTLSNFASGMLILIYRPFDVGDLVEVDSILGEVDSMTLLSTTIKTIDNKHVMIPNNNVWNSAIINVTGSKTRRVDMVFGIGYGDDFGQAQKIIQKILDDHDLVLNKPEAMIRVHELGDSSVNLICRPWVKTDDYWDVYWDVTEAVKREFDAQGVTIPFPQRDVHLFPA